MEDAKRLDIILVEKGYFSSRSKSQESINSGNVNINGQIINKCSALYKDNEIIDISVKKNEFVGRGGEKLSSAIKEFNINVKDKIAIDIGASTGGFSECLINNGVKLVYAVDVGHSQLSPILKNEPKIINLEKINARYLTLKRLKNILDEKAYPNEIICSADHINFAVIDVSFISILKIMPSLLNLLGPEPEIVALIKPQFEASRKEVRNKGVIKDIKVIEKIIDNVRKNLENMGLMIIDIMPSPIIGTKGNQEYLVYMSKKNAK